MLSVGLSLAVLTGVGCWLIWKKLPQRAQAWLIQHSLFTDFALFTVAYFILGGTLTALFAAAFLGIMVSIALEVSKNPEDYLWLLAARDEMRKQTKGIRLWFHDINEAYSKRMERERAAADPAPAVA